MNNNQNENRKKEFINCSTDEQLINKIRFEFDSIPVYEGYLQAHLDTDYGRMEIGIDVSNLVKPGEQLTDTEELRKYALKCFRTKC